MKEVKKIFKNEKTGVTVTLTNPIQIKAYTNEQSKKNGWKDVTPQVPQAPQVPNGQANAEK